MIYMPLKFLLNFSFLVFINNLKIISFYAKKARGLMTRYLIENEIKSENDILGFDYSGYSFSSEESKDLLNPVFVR